MKVINISVDKQTFTKLETGELVIDVRVDEIYKGIKHDIGDMLIYSMRDNQGRVVEDRNLAFLITTKVELQTFVDRIGEQMVGKRNDQSDDLVIVTLSEVGNREI